MADEIKPGEVPEGGASAPAPEKPKSDKVLISRTKLDEILNRIAQLESGQEVLEYAADKGRVAKFNSRNKSKIIRTCRLRIYKDKVVVGWGKMDIDVVDKNGNGVWTEEQVLTVFTEDGEKYKMRYRDFMQMTKVNCEITKKTEAGVSDEDHTIYNWDQDLAKLYYGVTVVEKGPHYGKKFELADSFINA